MDESITLLPRCSSARRSRRIWSEAVESMPTRRAKSMQTKRGLRPSTSASISTDIRSEPPKKAKLLRLRARTESESFESSRRSFGGRTTEELPGITCQLSMAFMYWIANTKEAQMVPAAMPSMTPKVSKLVRNMVTAKVIHTSRNSARVILPRDCTSQSFMMSTPKRHMVPPMYEFGRNWRISSGRTKRRSSPTATTRPFSRLWTCRFALKIVCEKMYEPVPPPTSPLARLLIPIVTSSWL
mmetsp:Transcript_59334/g.167141  ORF Transcript_59334/g.167141 Transcript_59334/m.167141 type:complete len:241 (-) Transcript_59334:990-1712(-)